MSIASLFSLLLFRKSFGLIASTNTPRISCFIFPQIPSARRLNYQLPYNLFHLFHPIHSRRKPFHIPKFQIQNK